MKLSELKLNPDNPRLIKDANFKKLVKSLKEDPELMRLKPIIVDESNMILGGNMRYRALLELKYKEVNEEWVKKATDFTPKQLKKFIIIDNQGYGEWDRDILGNEFIPEELYDWGVDNDFFKSDGILGIEETRTQEEEVEYFERTHILLSFPPQKLMEIQEHLEKIKEKEYVEYEQNSN
jgi:hypothetical protein